MYSFCSRIRYSELAQNGRLSLDGIINYMQDAACFEAESLGIGVGSDFEKSYTWVLNYWKIIIMRYPKMAEKMNIKTQACGFEKMFGYRNFMLTDENEGEIAKAYSIWTLIDREKMRPARVTPEIGGIYGEAEPIPMGEVSRKVKLPEGGEEQKAFFVQDYHLDTNHHVNNGQYVKMACAYLPQGFEVDHLQVWYRRQALLGDEIIPVVHEREGGRMIVLEGTDEKPYAVVDFISSGYDGRKNEQKDYIT